MDVSGAENDAARSVSIVAYIGLFALFFAGYRAYRQRVIRSRQDVAASIFTGGGKNGSVWGGRGSSKVNSRHHNSSSSLIKTTAPLTVTTLTAMHGDDHQQQDLESLYPSAASIAGRRMVHSETARSLFSTAMDFDDGDDDFENHHHYTQDDDLWDPCLRHSLRSQQHLYPGNCFLTPSTLDHRAYEQEHVHHHLTTTSNPMMTRDTQLEYNQMMLTMMMTPPVAQEEAAAPNANAAASAVSATTMQDSGSSALVPHLELLCRGSTGSSSNGNGNAAAAAQHARRATAANREQYFSVNMSEVSDVTYITEFTDGIPDDDLRPASYTTKK